MLYSQNLNVLPAEGAGGKGKRLQSWDGRSGTQLGGVCMEMVGDIIIEQYMVPIDRVSEWSMP